MTLKVLVWLAEGMFLLPPMTRLKGTKRTRDVTEQNTPKRPLLPQIICSNGGVTGIEYQEHFTSDAHRVEHVKRVISQPCQVSRNTPDEIEHEVGISNYFRNRPG